MHSIQKTEGSEIFLLTNANGQRPRAQKIVMGARCGRWEQFWDVQEMRRSEVRRDVFSRLPSRQLLASAVPVPGRSRYSGYKSTSTGFQPIGMLRRGDRYWQLGCSSSTGRPS